MKAPFQASILRHPQKSMAELLSQLAQRAEGATADVYGSGDLIAEFEQKIARMLGKPAALFLASGTLAQPLALRIYSERSQRSAVALHPTSHLMLHEQDGMQKLWGLQAVLTGHVERPIQLDDLQALDSEQLAAVLLELPMREIGGQLPAWNELVTQSEWARQHNIAVHFDGARLWQCPAYYHKSLSEISALADSVYVSLYKDLGGIAGAILAGEEDFIAEARIWNRRAGGNLISFYPYILAAEQGIEENLASISDAVTYAQRLGPLLATVPGVAVNPQQPQGAMFHLHIAHSHAAVIDATERYLHNHGILVLSKPRNANPDYSVCEISVGRSTMAQTPEFWHEHLSACLADIDQNEFDTSN